MLIPRIAPRAWRWCRRGLAAAALAAGWLLGCGDEAPTGLGSDLRQHPDTLQAIDFDSVVIDTVFHVPVSLGRSPRGQLGAELAYRAHILYDFQIPTRVVSGSDTFHLDTARLLLASDSLTSAPFQGTMRLRLQEVDANAKGWSPDSVREQLPALQPDVLAPDTLITGSSLAGHVAKIEFGIDLRHIDGFDSVRTRGEALDVNVALVFDGFTSSDGRGFLEIPILNAAGAETAKLIGFENGETNSIVTVVSSRHQPVVTFEAGAYSPGTKLAVSDGYPLHSYLRFRSLRGLLPESAVVQRADLVLTMVDSTDGTSFGAGPALGVMVPSSIDSIFARSTNRQGLAFKTILAAALPGSPVAINVTASRFDIQEGNVQDSGMLLRLSNEGTKVRHFEFYGGAAPAGKRPRLHIVYSVPAGFEGGGR